MQMCLCLALVFFSFQPTPHNKITSANSFMMSCCPSRVDGLTQEHILFVLTRTVRERIAPYITHFSQARTHNSNNECKIKILRGVKKSAYGFMDRMNVKRRCLYCTSLRHLPITPQPKFYSSLSLSLSHSFSTS